MCVDEIFAESYFLNESKTAVTLDKAWLLAKGLMF